MSTATPTPNAPNLSDQLAQVFSAAHSKVAALEVENAQLKAALSRFVDAFKALGFSPTQVATAAAQPSASPDAAPVDAAAPVQSAPVSGGAGFLNSSPGEQDVFAGSVDTVFPPDHQA